jgi:UDP-N-acetylglucosamine transferase subunit ALG13
MIFVTVGSSGKFDDLIRYMEALAVRNNEDVVIQTGKSEYEPKDCRHFRFAPDLKEYFEGAEIVVGHGGAGTCFEVLSIGKKLIGVENADVHDAHQWDLLQQLEEDGYLIWARQIGEIEGAIERARKTEFRKYVPPECEIASRIERFLRDGH